MSQKLADDLVLGHFRSMPDSFERARAFCQFAHRGQLRRGTSTPFATHPIAVTGILSQHTTDLAILIAALLHDVVEDTKFTLEDIKCLFGDEVADLVGQVSEIKTSPTGEKLSWIKRKTQVVQRLREEGAMGSLMIKVADHIHNLDDMKDLSREQFAANFHSTPEQRLWYSKEILQIATEKDVAPKLLQQLAQVIEDFEKKIA